MMEQSKEAIEVEDPAEAINFKVEEEETKVEVTETRRRTSKRLKKNIQPYEQSEVSLLTKRGK